MNMSRAGILNSQTLSLAEREIKYMLENGFRRPSVGDVWNEQNFSEEAASRAADPFEAGRARKVPWMAELRTFCSEASVVGLRFVANTSASPFRRFVWILLLIFGVGFTTFQIQSRIRYYFGYPVSVGIRVEHKKELRFPTVTICNDNMISRSAADSLGKSLVTPSITKWSLYRTYHVYRRV